MAIIRFSLNPYVASPCNRPLAPLTLTNHRKLYRARNWIRGWFLGAWILLLPACATVDTVTKQAESPPAEQLSQQHSTGENYWWYVPVTMVWPEEQPIEWYMDVLLAHQVFKPVLIRYAHDIELWRFHRRASRDNAGHRFSFIFYAREATAMAIFNDLAEDPIMAKLIAAHSVEKIRLHEANKTPDSAIEATSDKNWSQAMQRAWPYFALGVSQVWLALIDQHVAAMASTGSNSLEQNDIEALMVFYRQIDEKMVATWESEGGHALLHHLNALFGYGEVAIYERRMIRF
jgi:hypothetical protein